MIGNTIVRLARTTLTVGGVALALSACSPASNDGSMADTSSGSVELTTNGPSTPPAMAKPNAQMQGVLDQLAALDPKPIPTLTAAEARTQPTPADAAKRELAKQGKATAPDPAVASVDRTISTATGTLPVRIYTPKSGAGPRPVVVYYHGGGWVIADKNVYDGGARALSKLTNAVVVSVDYRQGPEHRFPAAHDDAIATYEWALKNAASIGGDPTKLALAGESAGGGLAVATAIAARDRKLQMPLAIVSVYPIAGTDTMTASYVENAQAKPLDRPMMSWFFENYLRGADDRGDPRVNLVAADLKGLPPTTIINAQIDPLRSEGESLAQKLGAAGVDVQQKTYAAVTHEFFGMGALIGEAMAAQEMAGNALRKAFVK
jgi:acetyl esterase/lipase